MIALDINFNFCQDSKCGDPDVDSPKLYEVHKFLWSKELPNGKYLDLKIIRGKNRRILLGNNLCDSFSSDRMCPHLTGKYGGKFDSWLSDEERLAFRHKARTIGGHIIFPAYNKNGFTINQARGVNKLIGDRFDLTLECIRRFYRGEYSPLYNTFLNYENFFELFVDFKGFIDFFLLQDFVEKDGQVKFSLPFDNFSRSPLPQNPDEYKNYKKHVIQMIDSRNNRILDYANK